MRLRTKTLIIIGLTLVGLVGILFTLTRGILLDSFRELEEMDVVKQTRQADALLKSAGADLRLLAGDWGGWDATYEFVVDGNQTYYDENLVDPTFETNRLNLIMGGM